VTRIFHRTRRFLVHKVLHTADTPHAIALGTGIATFVAFLPLIGIQTIIAVALAALFRANKAICIPVVWISNPVTLVPIYGACFRFGRFLMTGGEPRGAAQVLSKLEKHGGLSLLEPAFWSNLISRVAGYGVELWVGCVIIGFVSAILSYGLARWGVAAYRERRRRRLLQKSLLDPQFQADRVARPNEAA